MSTADLLYLAGYDPKTRELLTDHPIHGKLDEPIVDAGMIDYLEAIAKSRSSLHAGIKDIRNHRAFFTSPHGPHPKEDKPGYWRTHEDGFTYGPGRFWDSPFAKTGGAGMALATYHEALHATHAGEDGSSPFVEDMDDGGENFFRPNPINTTLANHFMPLKSRIIGELTGNKYGSKFSYTQQRSRASSKPSFAIWHRSKKCPNREGTTNKNNYTEHKTTLNPDYEHNDSPHDSARA